jgi:hypothetical protein
VRPEDFLPAAERNRIESEIRRDGFIVDELVGRLHTPTLGLNVALAWPLPLELHERYKDLASRLLGLGNCLYVYPYEQTHVTIATLVNFKRHLDPDENEHARQTALLPKVADILDGIARKTQPVKIEVGPPVLARAAAFLPILNRTGEVSLIRHSLVRRWEPSLSSPEVPRAIHSTVARLRAQPKSPLLLLAELGRIGNTVEMGSAVVREILLTVETRPYMADGRIVGRFALTG